MTILFATALSIAYVLICAYFVISIPVLHFLWNIGSFFLAFYALSAITNYGASVIFAIMIAVAIPLWDQHVSAEANVENTLRFALAGFIGAGVTAVVELALRHVRPGDDIVMPIADRLAAVHGLLVCLRGKPACRWPTEKQRYAGSLRSEHRDCARLFRRSDYSPEYRIQMRWWLHPR